jgi:hypothetical protein
MLCISNIPLADNGAEANAERQGKNGVQAELLTPGIHYS